MAVRSIIVQLGANIDDFRRGLNNASQLAERQAKAMTKVGTVALGMGAAMAAGLLISARAAIEWETAWAGVTKTVDGSASQMQELENGLRRMATTLPISAKEIAGVAESAGQLGVKREDILSFTKTMVDLGVSTNLTADEAATAIAQIGNVMGVAGPDVARFGATLVALGNDGASTEKDILMMAQRISGAGKTVGATASDVLALANGLSSMGIQAELGGGVTTRALLKMNSAVASGGEALESFASTAGMSSEEFVQAFKDRPVAAFDAFTHGLGRINASGQDVSKALKEVGLAGTLNSQVLLQMAGSGDLLAHSLELGNTSWRENKALVEEANKRYDTTASKLQVAKNSVNELAINLGDFLLPAISDAAGGISNLTGFLSGLPDGVQATLVVVSGLGAVLAVAGGAALIIIPKFLALQSTLTGLGMSAATANVWVARLSTTLKVAGVASAVLAVAAALGYFVEKVTKAQASDINVLSASLSDFAQNGKVSGKAAKIAGEDFGGLVKAIDNSQRSLWGAKGNITKWSKMDDDFKGIRQSRQDIEDLDDALAQMVAGGRAEDAAKVYGRMAASAKENGKSVEWLAKRFPDYADAVRIAQVEQEKATQGAYDQAAAIGGASDAAGSAITNLGAYAKAQGYGKDETEALTKQIQDWGQALADFVQPLDAYTSLLQDKQAKEQETAQATADATSNQKDSWEDYVKKVRVSVGEYLTELEKQVKAQTDWQTNMLVLSTKVSEGTLDQLARMGPEGAPLVAELVNASDAELERLEGLFERRTAGATDAAATQLKLAAPVLKDLGGKLGKGVVDDLAAKLAAGTETVATIAQKYAVVLAGGVNPLLVSLGKNKIAVANDVPYRAGLGVTYNADGNLYEQHTAQIAPAGAMRVWAEPETGGEAYIPLADSKSTRSRSIWEEVGRRKGWGQTVEMFDTGGFFNAGQVPKPPSTAPYGSPISTAADATMGAGYDRVLRFLESMPVGGGGTVGGLEGIRDFIRHTDPLPYIWGGVGPGGYDCSGLVGQVYAMATGRPQFRRYFTTDTIGAAQGFKPGTGGVLSVGVTPGRGHMAGEYGGLRFEAESTKTGIKIGQAASPVSSFARHFHLDGGTSGMSGKQVQMLANGGILDAVAALGQRRDVAGDPARLVVDDKQMPLGSLLNPHVRDGGGPLLPGWTFNGTGRSEPTHWVQGPASGGRSTPYPQQGRSGARPMTGTLTLDSGEFLGVVRGVVEESDNEWATGLHHRVST